MKYDVGYNLTEEVRMLMDAHYKKDVAGFETAKQHILLLLGKPEIDLKEYADKKTELVKEFFKILDEQYKEIHNEQLIGVISADLEQLFNAYNSITMKYMDDTLVFLMSCINGK